MKKCLIVAVSKNLRCKPLRMTLTGALLIASPAYGAELATTLARTIQDRNHDNRLEYALGEPYVVRLELGQALPGRDQRRLSQVFFAQLTDSHLIDEESPLRVEFLDQFGPPLTSAYRPHEGLSPQVQHEMVRQVRNAVSPITKHKVELVMTTGDNSDNTQLNEVRWFIDLLDGNVEIDPNSGVIGTCGTAPDGHLYDGVRNRGLYYEPDRSGPPGANTIDGPGYAPLAAENEAKAGRASALRDFPGLFEDMNRPFYAVGLGVPWYSIFGNHDGLILGNQPRNPILEAIATGCVKLMGVSGGVLGYLREQAGREAMGEDHTPLMSRLFETTALTAAPDSGMPVAIVPLDPKRRPLRKREYIAEHFTTRGIPVGHGFTEANLATGQGNFMFRPKSGLKFIVLDSVAENGRADGNLDDTQFRWLHQELLDAERHRELVMVFAHHSLRTMNMPPVSPFPAGDQGGDPSPLVHFGIGADAHLPQPCLISDPSVLPTPDETLRCLFLRHPSVIAFVVGHEHLNRIMANARHDVAGQVSGGFWEITTASHIDWPQQSRLIELFDNQDGTLSIFGTLIDHHAPPRPGRSGSDTGDSPRSTSLLASIARELSYNDPDSNNGEDGQLNAWGSRRDRNVELLIKNPY